MRAEVEDGVIDKAVVVRNVGARLEQIPLLYGIKAACRRHFWEAARKRRNWASHPQDQLITMPGLAARAAYR